MNEYYKKIDKSFFKYGITIPNNYITIFEQDEAIDLGSFRDIEINFKSKNYHCKLQNVNRKKAKNVFQIRWDNNFELITELKKEFIQSYFAIMSQNYIAKEKNEYYVTNLLGGNQEVAIFKPINLTTIKLDTFIKIETAYDNLFKQIVDENVFGWLSKENQSQMITKSSKWIEASQLKLHEDTPYVVYYLIDDTNKQIYIGSAKRLGDRIKTNRKEIPGWNRFRYEIIHPKFHSFIKQIEYHSIMNFARFYKNNGNLSSAEISDYVLVNKDYKYYQK